MCWHLRVAVDLVAGHLPLLLLEVEVKVLLQVVRVELPLRRHDRHLGRDVDLLCLIFLLCLPLTLVLLPAGLQIGANISSEPFSPLTDSYFGTWHQI